MHEDNLPRGSTPFDITHEPVQLFVFQRLAACTELEKLCIEDDAVYCAEIKGVIVPPKLCAAVVRQFKCAQIARRQCRCPIQAVIFMIAEDRYMNAARQRILCSLHRREEAAPMP